MSLRFIKKLQQLDCGSICLKSSLQFAMEQYLQTRRILKEITLAIRDLSKQDSFKKVQTILQSIDGIGLINGMVIQTEIDDIHRFKRLDGKSTKIDPLTPTLFKAKFVWRMGSRHLDFPILTQLYN